jgi:pimeloyl-ACP methyl ester carboxylesterase
MRFLVHLFIAGIVAAGLPARAADPVAGRHEWIDAGGSRLYVETFGSGSPIVFLHGGIHHFDNSFAIQRDAFAPTHTVIGIDQRGHGHSPDDARPFSYEAMAEDTAAVIRQLGLGPVDVVGHSDGGNVGLRLALAHPELVRRLVISGASLRAGLPADELQRRLAWSPQQLAEFLPKFERQIPPDFRRDYEAVTPQGADHWSAFLAKSYRLWLTPVVISAAELKAIQAPVLVIAGDKDFSSIEDTAEIYRGLGKAQLFIVPGAGHGTFTDRPELVDLAIREFLDKP